MVEIAALTADQRRRLLAMLRRFEADERSEAGGPGSRRPSDPVQVLKITGAAVSGEYPAKLSWWDAAGSAETLSEEVRYRPAAPGVTHAAGDYVVGRFTGPAASDATKGLYRGAGGGGVATSAPLFYVSGPVDPDTGYHPAQMVLSWDTAEDEAVLEEAEVWWAPASGECGLIPGYYFGMNTGGTVGLGEDEALAYVGESWGEQVVPGRVTGFTGVPVCVDGVFTRIDGASFTYDADITLRGVGLAAVPPPPPPDPEPEGEV